MPISTALRALANDRRLLILEWLKRPKAHFPAQVDGDLIKDGVCGVLIADKLEVSQPTTSEHLKILLQAGLIRSKRIKQWTFYKRDEAHIKAIKQAIQQKVAFSAFASHGVRPETTIADRQPFQRCDDRPP